MVSKSKIIDIKKTILNDLKTTIPALEMFEEAQLMKMCFKTKGCLRLTKEGLKLLSRVYEHSVFEISEAELLNSKEVLKISRKSFTPYFLNKSIYVCFNTEDTVYILLAGSVKQWLKVID